MAVCTTYPARRQISMNTISTGNQCLLNTASAGNGTSTDTGSSPEASINLQDMLGSLRNQDDTLEQKMQELKKQCDAIEAEKKVLSKKQKIGAVMAVAEIAGLVGGFVTGSMLFVLGCGVFGIACMGMAVKNTMRSQKISQDSIQYTQQWGPLFEQKQSMEKKIHEMESKITRAETDVRDSVQSLSSEEECRINDSADEFVIIDGVKLDKKMKKI